MTWMEDLSPYDDGGPPPSNRELAVGWLDSGHPFPTGTLPKVLRHLVIDRLTFAAAHLPTQRSASMGIHGCAFCAGPSHPLPGRGLWGSGEMRVIDPDDGTVYVAPSLVAHYISDHAYLPPPQFVEAVAAGVFIEPTEFPADQPVVDRVEDSTEDLRVAVGATAVVHGHLEPWTGGVGEPILGFAIDRAWYGPWDGTIDNAHDLVEGTPLGFTPP